MFEWLQPHRRYKSLANISFEEWKAKGVKWVLLDLDNTLIRHGDSELSLYAKAQLRRISQAGLSMALLSNAKSRRAKAFGQQAGLEVILNARKPSISAVRKLQLREALQPQEILLIGDQLFTDVLCGRRAGIWSILVDPLSTEEVWYIRMKRVLERWLLGEDSSKRKSDRRARQAYRSRIRGRRKARLLQLVRKGRSRFQSLRQLSRGERTQAFYFTQAKQ